MSISLKVGLSFMNKNKLLLTSVTALTLGGLVLGGGALALSVVNADEMPSDQTVFEKVVSKLGLKVSSDELKNAFEESRHEVMSENLDTELASAVKAGSLTQEQADLAKKIEDWRQSNKPDITKTDTSLSREEMRQQMESTRSEMDAKMLADLGITQAQLDELQTSLRDADIRPMMRGPRDHGDKQQGMMKDANGPMRNNQSMSN
ncbi:hypothetical protein IPJ91_01795 [bacterium]|nr:MAG: hypothetical protein IPJ91_01795 [bacterium]